MVQSLLHLKPNALEQKDALSEHPASLMNIVHIFMQVIRPYIIRELMSHNTYIFPIVRDLCKDTNINNFINF
jgi:hypothetical protein